MQLLRLMPRYIGNRPIEAPVNNIIKPTMPVKIKTRNVIKMMVIFSICEYGMLLNLFAKVLPTIQVNGYENAAEITIAMRKYMKFSGGKIEVHSGIGIILDMTKATPLLALIIIKSAAETKIIHAVFTADNVIIVCLVLVSPLAVIAIIVPVADVAPGTIATNAPDIVPVITEIIDFVEFLIRGSLIR